MKFFSDKKNVSLIIKIIFSFVIGFLVSSYSVTLGFIVSLILVLTIVYKNISFREKRVNNLMQYLKSLNQGDYAYDISGYEEGELSKLQSELNKTTVILRNLNYDIEEQKNALQEALENISHQLKTPISSLLLLNEIQEQNEEVVRSKEQIERLDYLSDVLISLIRLDANLESFYMEQINVNDLLRQVESLSIPNLDNLNLNINHSDLVVYADYDKTVESLFNVLNNKLRYANKDIFINVSEDNFYTYISIWDDGQTIENRDQVFDRFYSKNKNDSRSVGIGLSIAKEYMLEQNAELYIEDKNTFVFKFKK